MGLEKFFMGTILVLTIALTLVVGFGFYASMTAKNVVGRGYPVSSEGGGVSPSSVTYQGVVNMFNVAEPIKVSMTSIINGTWSHSCDSLCGDRGKRCIDALYGELSPISFDFISCDAIVESVDHARNLQCRCVSLP